MRKELKIVESLGNSSSLLSACPCILSLQTHGKEKESLMTLFTWDKREKEREREKEGEKRKMDKWSSYEPMPQACMLWLWLSQWQDVMTMITDSYANWMKKSWELPNLFIPIPLFCCFEFLFFSLSLFLSLSLSLSLSLFLPLFSFAH